MTRWEIAFRLVGLGWYVGISIFLGVVGGRWLDGKLRAAPAFMIGGLILGIVVAFYGAYQMIIPIFGAGNNNNKKGDEDN